MADPVCPLCQKAFNDTKEQKRERSQVQTMLKLIRMAGLKEAVEKTKDGCYECWKKEFRALVQPFAAALGKDFVEKTEEKS